jgi:vesicle coat complex subunit
VLEDLCAEGFKMAERRHGLDLAHCLLVMRLLAKFHAASVVLHDQEPESMSIYDQSLFSEPVVIEGLRNFVSGMYYRSQMSLLTQSIIKFYELSRR